jgi:hypothetical protein
LASYSWRFTSANSTSFTILNFETPTTLRPGSRSRRRSGWCLEGRLGLEVVAGEEVLERRLVGLGERRIKVHRRMLK